MDKLEKYYEMLKNEKYENLQNPGSLSLSPSLFFSVFS